jgi:hypothetical protein
MLLNLVYYYCVISRLFVTFETFFKTRRYRLQYEYNPQASYLNRLKKGRRGSL